MPWGRNLIFAAAIGLPLLAGPVPDCARADTVPVARPASAIEAAPGARVAAAPRPDAPDRRCTADGSYCIGGATYVADVCGIIEAAARDNGLDPDFFARLIWRESLFDAAAVSPVGAQGIAQFMPGTARRRGLGDPFNPAEALDVSAQYLAELSRGYGNIGLAAVAYNGGEARAARFIAGDGDLAPETRAYVQAVTGRSAESWRDAPPATVDLKLAAGQPFRSACIAQAGKRDLRAPASAAPTLPWGVIVASNRERDGAERQVGRLQNRYASVLGAETVTYRRARLSDMPARLYMAQIGRGSRAEADALCSRLRATGGDCMVLRN